jgi:hypothetical protein
MAMPSKGCLVDRPIGNLNACPNGLYFQKNRYNLLVRTGRSGVDCTVREGTLFRFDFACIYSLIFVDSGRFSTQ